MKYLTKQLISSVIASGAAISGIIHAAEEASPNSYVSRIEGIVAHYQFDENIARAEGISDSGYGIGIQYRGIVNEYFTFAAGFSILDIDDDNSFSQTVEGTGPFNDGDVSTEKSDIDAGTINAEMGVRYPFGNKVSAILSVGYRYFDIDRQIDFCEDCRSDNIDIESTTYFKPQLDVMFTETFGASVTYSVYTGDKGADNSAALQFIYAF